MPLLTAKQTTLSLAFYVRRSCNCPSGHVTVSTRLLTNRLFRCASVVTLNLAQLDREWLEWLAAESD
jgi:hypothetical protein